MENLNIKKRRLVVVLYVIITSCWWLKLNDDCFVYDVIVPLIKFPWWTNISPNFFWVSTTWKVELLLDHMGSEITHDCNDIFNCDYHLLEETTADGYEVYTFKKQNEEFV